MGTWAQEIINQIDNIGTGGFAFSTALLNTTIGQIIIVVFGLMLFALIVYIVFAVFSKVGGKKWK